MKKIKLNADLYVGDDKLATVKDITDNIDVTVRDYLTENPPQTYDDTEVKSSINHIVNLSGITKKLWNEFDITDITRGKYLKDGDDMDVLSSANTSYFVYNKIFEVGESDVIYISNKTSALYFYDADKHFIKRATNTNLHRIPSGTRYVRFGGANNDESLTSLNLMIRVNRPLSISYKPYGEYEDIFEPSKGTSRTLVVAKDGNGDFSTVQDAVNSANDGDTIIVYPGSYEESVDFGYKFLHLKGFGKESTIIWNDTGDYNTPPLAACTGLIEGITFYAKVNEDKDYSGVTRKGYAWHLDQRWYGPNKSVIARDCKFVNKHGPAAIGCGVVDDSNIELYNCIGDVTGVENGTVFQAHGDKKGTGNANITFVGCSLKKGEVGNGRGCLLSNGGADGNTGTTITVKANNNYGTFYNHMGDLFILDESSFGNTDSGWNA